MSQNKNKIRKEKERKKKKREKKKIKEGKILFYGNLKTKISN